MNSDLIITAITVVASMLAGLIGVSAPSEKLIKKLYIKLGGKEFEDQIPYSEKLTNLTSNLMKSSKEMDALLAELAQVAKDREQAVKKMEADLSNLQGREQELQKKIEHLEKVPLPVAEYFAQLTSTGEKRSARRDYLLFGAGVVVSTVIAILLKIFGLG
jgi:hypothetical protein